MKVVSDSLNESCPDVVCSIDSLHLLADWSNILDNFVSFGLVKQIWNFSTVENIVHILQETLIDNLGISEQEYDLYAVGPSSDH